MNYICLETVLVIYLFLNNNSKDRKNVVDIILKTFGRFNEEKKLCLTHIDLKKILKYFLILSRFCLTKFIIRKIQNSINSQHRTLNLKNIKHIWYIYFLVSTFRSRIFYYSSVKIGRFQVCHSFSEFDSVTLCCESVKIPNIKMSRRQNICRKIMIHVYGNS